MITEEGIGADPIEEITEEGVEAESTEESVVEESYGEEGSDDSAWGEDHPDDTLSDDLSTMEGEDISQDSTKEAPKKTAVQLRIDELTRSRKEVEAREAHLKNTNDFLMQELNKQKTVAAQPPLPPAEKEPAWEEFEEKYSDDPEKATREYLVAKQEYSMKQYLKDQRQRETALTEQNRRAAISQKFKTDSYTPEVLEKYPDFHAKVYHPTVVFNDPDITHIIESSPQRFDLAYRLAMDTDLRAKINSSSKAEAGALIGDLQRLYASPVKKRFKTKKPASVPKIGSSGGAATPGDTDMDIDEFLKKEDAKQVAGGGW